MVTASGKVLVMTKIKICGLTNLADALVAVEAGADLLGFIFYEPSPRYVVPQTVREIIVTLRQQLGQFEEVTLPQFVGVFVNTPQPVVAETLAECGLDRAQLHGEESPEFVWSLAGRAFKAIRPQSQAEAERLVATYLPADNHPEPPALLLDAYHPALYGGTGRVTDWALAANLARRYPLMLAGSLTADNVAEAVEAVQPWAVDVSSGVEAAKGRKDHTKMRAFVAAVRNVKREI